MDQCLIIMIWIIMIDTIQMNEYIYDMDKMMWILMIWLTKY